MGDQGSVDWILTFTSLGGAFLHKLFISLRVMRVVFTQNLPPLPPRILYENKSGDKTRMLLIC